jgi:hypothetical protein
MITWQILAQYKIVKKQFNAETLLAQKFFIFAQL